MATRKQSRKLADPEPVADEDSDDEQEQGQNTQEFEDEAEDALDVAGEDSADESDDSDEDSDEADEADETQEFADKKPAFKGAAKPFGKGGKKPANDAEDEELDDMTSDDEEYDDGTADDGEPDGDEDEMMPPAKGKAGKGKGMPVKKMTEPQLQAEVTRLREESRLKDEQIKTLREEQFKIGVSKKLSEFTRNIRTDSEDAEFALPRSFRLAYQEFMFEHGIRLSESSLTKLNDLVEKALRLGTVPLTSLANQIEDGRVIDADDRRPREHGGARVDRTPDAEKIALSEYKMTLSDLVKKDPEKAEAIYMRLEAQTRRGKPAA